MAKRRLMMGMLLPLIFGAVLFGQNAPTNDVELSQILEKTGLRYQSMPDGGVKLHFELDKGRTHQVLIKKERNVIGSLQLWEAIAFVWKGSARPSAQIAHRLLSDNSNRKIGAWEMVSREESEYYILFNAKIPVGCDPASLKVILQIVAFGADQMESTVSDGDDF